MLAKIVAIALAAGASVLATPVESRQDNITVVPHDQVVGFPQEVPKDAIGATYLRFKPWLYVYNGCVPYPAVEANGSVR
jgi:hypothetical protein